MTQRQFATAIGVSQGWVSQFEAGTATPRGSTKILLHQLAERAPAAPPDAG